MGAAVQVQDIVRLTTFDTVLGPVTIAATERGMVTCSLPGRSEASVRRWVARNLPEAEVVEGGPWNARYVKAVRDFLAGKRKDLDLPLDVRGTDFQKKVWAELRKVPFGQTVSYAELARRAGAPGAARACGAANGSNPLPLFIPCHRVVASDGSLGGFGGGLPLKKKLLELEARAG